jgi:hypothetical protein
VGARLKRAGQLNGGGRRNAAGRLNLAGSPSGAAPVNGAGPLNGAARLVIGVLAVAVVFFSIAFAVSTARVNALEAHVDTVRSEATTNNRDIAVILEKLRHIECLVEEMRESLREMR